VLYCVIWAAMGALLSIGIFGVFTRNSWETRFDAPFTVPVVAAVGAGVACLAAAARALILWQSGAATALSAMRATPVGDGDDHFLVHIVEELSVAAGITPPAVYTVEARGLNLLSVRSPGVPPAIVLTRGVCTALTREELLAVMAHEIVHVRDGDGAAPLYAGVLFGSIERWARLVLDEARLFLIWIPAALLWGLTGLAWAIAVKRRGEITDLASIQLTRDPAALADALAKMMDADRHVGAGEHLVAPLLFAPVRRHKPVASRRRAPASSVDEEMERRLAAVRGLASQPESGWDGAAGSPET